MSRCSWCGTDPCKVGRDFPTPHAPTLRDSFAMAALTGLCASDVDYPADGFAARAYILADAMLLARGKDTK